MSDAFGLLTIEKDQDPFKIHLKISYCLHDMLDGKQTQMANNVTFNMAHNVTFNMHQYIKS